MSRWRDTGNGLYPMYSEALITAVDSLDAA